MLCFAAAMGLEELRHRHCKLFSIKFSSRQLMIYTEAIHDQVLGRKLYEPLHLAARI